MPESASLLNKQFERGEQITTYFIKQIVSSVLSLSTREKQENMKNQITIGGILYFTTDIY